MPLVRYIGAKERKEDNVAATGAVWYGFGDVVDIASAAKASQLARHSLVWEIVPPESVDRAPRQIVGEPADGKTDEQKPTLANMSLGNPDEQDDEDGSVTVAPGARPPAPGTENVPPVATAAGPRQSGRGRGGRSSN